MIATPWPSSDSPALRCSGAGAPPAYEIKFLIEESLAAEIATWAEVHLRADDHGDPSLGGAYRSATVYLDTATLDVLHRTPGHRRTRFRVRRYGDEPTLHLERKRRRGDRIAKRRAMVALADWPWLGAPARAVRPGDEWPGEWFRERIAARGLGPAAWIAYRRHAWSGAEGGRALRLTIDRDLHGAPTTQWLAPPAGGGPALLSGRAVLEIKFADALPDGFKRLLSEFQLHPVALSKYRLCRGDVLGAAAAAPPLVEAPGV